MLRKEGFRILIKAIIIMVVILFLAWLFVLPIKTSNETERISSYVMLPYVACHNDEDCVPSSDIHLCCINKNYTRNIKELTKHEEKCPLNITKVTCHCHFPEGWDHGFCTAHTYVYKQCEGLDCIRIEARKLLRSLLLPSH